MIIVPRHFIDTFNTEASLGTADIIVEAITEVLPLKQRLFKQWDQMCPDKTIFATNTSFLKVMKSRSYKESLQDRARPSQ